MEIIVAEVNTLISGTDSDLVKIDAGLDPNELPANQSNNRYMLKFESYEQRNSESAVFDFTAVVELMFEIPNSDTTKYKSVIDDYVHRLVKGIITTSSYSYSSSWKLEVQQVGARKLNEFSDSEFSPEITLTGFIIDAT